MDLLKNPFHILGATPRDNRQRIMELAEKRSLLSDADVSDADEYIEARSTLIHPRNRISAEIAWLPGVGPFRTDDVLNILKKSETLRMEMFYKLMAYMENIDETDYEQGLFGREKLIPLSRANLLASGLSCVRDYSSEDVRFWITSLYRPDPPTTIRWILEIAQAFERIELEELRKTVNEERKESGFPAITNLSTLENELYNRRQHYQQVIKLTLKDLSVWDLARAVTIGLEKATNNGEKHGPILIKNLVDWYETDTQVTLENIGEKIKIFIQDIRGRADAKQNDSNLGFMIDELIQTIKEWDTIAQPIQLSTRSRGERHDASFEIAGCIRKLSIDLFNKYGKFDFSQQITNTLKEVFAEVIEVDELITADLEALEKQGVFEKINTQVEKLKEAADAKMPDNNLTAMVNQLIQTVKTWETSGQPVEANELVALTVRGIALHLWNEHQEAEFSLQITNALLQVFSTIPKIVKLFAEDKKILEKHVVLAKGLKKFEEIRKQIDSIKEAADAYKPDYALTSMVTQLIQTVGTWDPYEQPFEANEAVAYSVRGIALHLWNKHQKLDFAIQITTAIIAKFKNVIGMDKVNDQLNQDLVTLMSIKQAQQRKGTGCLLQIAIFGILGLIGALLQGC